MKHKVKEIFDNREEYRRWEDDVQELFNCQFTLDDLIILSLGLKVLMTVDKYFGSDNKNVQRVKEKIKKQKEMWVSEDE